MPITGNVNIISLFLENVVFMLFYKKSGKPAAASGGASRAYLLGQSNANALRKVCRGQAGIGPEQRAHGQVIFQGNGLQGFFRPQGDGAR